jgi:peptidyl-prolyl cis-trans isomerase SurA
LIVFDKKTNLKEIEKYLKKHSFADAAIKYSIDKSAKNGGYIGWIKLHSLSEELQQLSKDKTYGETFFYEDKKGKKMLFYIEGIKSKYDVDSELRSKIVNMLQKERSKKVYEDWIKKNRELIFIREINS